MGRAAPSGDRACERPRSRVLGRALAALLAAGALGCSQEQSAAPLPVEEAAPYVGRLPLGFPPPRVPPGNPMTPAKIELGRYLFYDTRLSGSGAQSCSSCHQQARAFSDGRAHAIGSTGETHPRSAMSLTNVAYNARLGWADPTLDSLEAQVAVPLFNRSPIEMGVAGREQEVMARLAATDLYPPLFARAFPGDPAPLQIENVARAIASFERTLVSGDAPYDRLLFRDDRAALSESAKRGMALFFSERLRCSRCHAGLHLAGGTERRRAEGAESFHNTALYDLDGRGRYPHPNEGLYRFTARPDDMGRFRAPTLRNVAVTAPYMHDGSLPTLEAVIRHYAAGGRAASNPYKSEELAGFELDAAGVADLVAFLESLTDRTFLEDPRFADPFAGALRARSGAADP